jgi:hypothetical protein
MKAEQIKTWLLKQPRPAVVRVTDEHGAIHDVVCGQSTWVKVAETVEAMRPELINALNSSKEVLRALRPADMSEDWTDDDDDEQPAAAMRPSAPVVPEIPFDRLDGESARFVLFARLISEAYRHSNEVAFTRLAGIVENLTRNQGNVDRAREQMYRAHVRQLEEALKAANVEVPEQPGGDMMQAMLGGFLQSMMAGGGGVPNGKGAA